MSELKKIAYNCRKATFLIEKKQIDRLTLREKLELKIHLAGCSVCRTFQQQSIVINKMVRDLLHSAQNREITLDKEFKDELQNRIEEELSKN